MVSKIRFTSIFIFLLLLINFTIRITTSTYPYGSDDTNRDYLVAHHITTYNEYPLTGPFVAITRARNSPTYYYFISIFTHIKDDPLTLRVLNIMLQVSTIFIIFKIARRLYDLPTAVLSSILISFNNFSLYQSAFLWQPWVMQPFINLSYLLLIIALQNRNYLTLICAMVCFIFAGSLHPSAFALTPIFIIISIAILISQKSKPKQYICLAAASVISFLTFYLSLLLTYAKSYNMFSAISSSSMLGIYSPIDVFLNFMKNITYLIGGFLFHVSTDTKLNNLLALTVCLFIASYFYLKKEKKEKAYSIFLLLPIILLLTCFSVIYVRIFKSSYGIHYFTAVYGLFIILFSRALIFIFSKNKYLKIAGVSLLILYLGYFFNDIYHKFYKNRPTYTLQYLNDLAINAIKNDVINIHKSGRYTNYNFFKIESHAGGKFGWNYNATVWAVLERELNAKFTKIDDYNQDGFTQIISKNADYVFLICPLTSNIESIDNECEKKFLTNNIKYSNIKETYSNTSYRINLMKKN